MGADLAQFMLGIPQGQMQRSGSFADQETFFGLYLQDNWKLTRRLTLTAGLRLEHESPVSERFDRSIKGFDYAAVNPIAARAQANYALMGGGSPLLKETQAQARALETALAGRLPAAQVKTFIAMRYWSPNTAETAKAVAAFAPDDVLLVPLYPQ